MLFSADHKKAPKLEADLEAMLEERFGTPLLVVIRSRDELAETIDAAPADHGSPKLRSDIFFLKHPLTAEKALAEMPSFARASIPWRPVRARSTSRVWPRGRRRPASRSSWACLIFQQVTVRTWRTSVGLLEKLDAADGART